MTCCGDDRVLTTDEIAKLGECPACGAKVDEEGEAVDRCSYSPVECEFCGWQPCDGSC